MRFYNIRLSRVYFSKNPETDKKTLNKINENELLLD